MATENDPKSMISMSAKDGILTLDFGKVSIEFPGVNVIEEFNNINFSAKHVNNILLAVSGNSSSKVSISPKAMMCTMTKDGVDFIFVSPVARGL